MTSPSIADEPLWSGELVPSVRRGLGAEDEPPPANPPPQLTIGKPVVLGDARSLLGAAIDGATASLLERYDYHVVRFACSFRTNRKVQAARFDVQLAGDGETEPVAFDLFPLRVDQKVDRAVKLSFAPNLKLGAVNVGTGSIDLNVSYAELQPTIYAEGIQESQVTWVFQSAAGASPVGAQQLVMVVQTSHDTRSCRADLRFNATVDNWLWIPNPAQLAEPLLGLVLWP